MKAKLLSIRALNWILGLGICGLLSYAAGHYMAYYAHLMPGGITY